MGRGLLRQQLWYPQAYKLSNYWADKDFMRQVTVTLTFDLLTPKSIGISNGT